MRPIIPMCLVFSLGAGLVPPALAGSGHEARGGDGAGAMVVLTAGLTRSTPAPALRPSTPTPGISRSTPTPGINRAVPRPHTGPRRAHRKRQGRRPFVPFFPFIHEHGHDYGHDHGREVIVQPAPVEPPPEDIETAEPPPPPDPRGPLRRKPARGVAPAVAAYTVGEPLPPDVPHVTLGWEIYAFPEPSPGHIYARVGREILLIVADSRMVVRVLPPG